MIIKTLFLAQMLAKVRLEDSQEFRKLPLAASFSDLKRIFSERCGLDIEQLGKLSYVDDDGDRIVITSEEEYTCLLNDLPVRTLRATVSLKSQCNDQLNDDNFLSVQTTALSGQSSKIMPGFCPSSPNRLSFISSVDDTSLAGIFSFLSVS